MAYYCVHKRGKAKPIGKAFKLMIENIWEMGVLAHMSKDGKRSPKHFPGMGATSMGSLFMDHHLTNKSMCVDKKGIYKVVNAAEQSGEYTQVNTHSKTLTLCSALAYVNSHLCSHRWHNVLVRENTLS